MPKFLRQDYHTHKRLKLKWRRPKGRQSKLRVSKGGSGVRPRIGFKGHGEVVPVVRNISQLEGYKNQSVFLASQLGAKKAAEIAKRAGELGIKILNKRKLEKAEKIAKQLEQKSRKSAKEEKSAESAAAKEVKSDA